MKAVLSAALLLTVGVACLVACGSSARRTLSPPHRDRLVSARFPSYGLSLRYPVNWTRQKCRWVTTETSNITYLTMAEPRACTNSDTGWPETLDPDDVAVMWMESSFPGIKLGSSPGRSTRIDGHAARVAVMTPSDRALQMTCGTTSGAQRLVLAAIESSAGEIRMAACLRGPQFGSNEAAVHQMLSSVHLSRAG